MLYVCYTVVDHVVYFQVTSKHVSWSAMGYLFSFTVIKITRHVYVLMWSGA